MKPTNRNRILNIAGAIAIVLLVIEVAQTVKKNFQLRQQITQLETEIQQLEEQKIELGYRIAYYQTDAFKEKEARDKLGLQKPGEGVIIIPPKSVDSGAKKKPSKPKSNWQQWMEFLSGRNAS